MEESASVLFRAVVVAAGVTGVGAGEVSWGSSDAGGGVLAPVGSGALSDRAGSVFFLLLFEASVLLRAVMVAACLSGGWAGEVSWGSSNARGGVLAPVGGRSFDKRAGSVFFFLLFFDEASVLFSAVVVAAGVTGIGAGEVSWGSSDAR